MAKTEMNIAEMAKTHGTFQGYDKEIRPGRLIDGTNESAFTLSRRSEAFAQRIPTKSQKKKYEIVGQVKLKKADITSKKSGRMNIA